MVMTFREINLSLLLCSRCIQVEQSLNCKETIVMKREFL